MTLVERGIGGDDVEAVGREITEAISPADLDVEAVCLSGGAGGGHGRPGDIGRCGLQAVPGEEGGDHPVYASEVQGSPALGLQVV